MYDIGRWRAEGTDRFVWRIQQLPPFPRVIPFLALHLPSSPLASDRNSVYGLCHCSRIQCVRRATPTMAKQSATVLSTDWNFLRTRKIIFIKCLAAKLFRELLLWNRLFPFSRRARWNEMAYEEAACDFDWSKNNHWETEKQWAKRNRDTSVKSWNNKLSPARL